MAGAIFRRLARDIRDVALAARAPHADLRRRLVTATCLTVVVDLLATLCLYLAEADRSGSQIHGPWDAFYFTTAQMVTISTSMANPVTRPGQILCLVIDIYAITVVSAIAGMFSAFFHHRREAGDSLDQG